MVFEPGLALPTQGVGKLHSRLVTAKSTRLPLSPLGSGISLSGRLKMSTFLILTPATYYIWKLNTQLNIAKK